MGEAPLRVELLGDLRAWLGTEKVTLGPARQRAVFAVLASRAGRLVPRGELIEGVWGASPPASANGGVHTYVSGLRRVLEPGRPRWSPATVLVSEPDGYRLRLPPEHLDLRAFRSLRQRADKRARAGDHRAAVELLDTALGHWRGEAFAGIPGPFAERHRARLTEQRQDAVEQRVRSRLELGEHAELIVELAAMIGQQPSRESAWALLITALHRGGRYTEALEVVARMRTYLRRELGTEPGPAIRSLHQQLLVDIPEPEAPATPVPGRAGELLSVLPAAAPSTVPARRLVAPERETTRLRGYLDAVLVGRGRAVLVEGDPGDLLTATLAGAGHRGCHVGWAVADRRPPFPLRVITDALGAGPTHPTRTDLLERVDDLCTTAPLVFVVEDLHHADDASLLLWHQLASATRLLPLLLVATCRPAEGHGVFAMLRRGVLARAGEVIRLAPERAIAMGQECRVGPTPYRSEPRA